MEKVSIPYRYATNRGIDKKIGVWYSSFNPLQVRYKQFAPTQIFPYSACFNPLQVRYKHWSKYLPFRSFPCFNPLQVRYKLHCGKRIFLWVHKFQSLIGTLQTGKVKYEYSISRGFNPLQVRYKRTGPIEPLITHPWFQSLIGTLQTHERKRNGR